MIKIVYKDKNAVVIYKPAGVPTQSDASGDKDALSITAEMLKENSEPSDLWLVHRLDRVVGGLVAFARNKESAAALSALVGGNGMVKEYLSVVEGEAKGGELRDFIFKSASAGRAYVVDRPRRSAKEARLEYKPLAYADVGEKRRTLVRIKLHTGRFHQIRVQFASRGNSIVGDGKYGNRDNKARLPALFASRLEFHLFGRDISLSIKPDISEYPWSIFSEDKYNDA